MEISIVVVNKESRVADDRQSDPPPKIEGSAREA
jgi:hypothetical protein